ncbi:hypothetical protein ACODT3_32045 [Streptomyces sp. 4.24]|uniref:hypothetical protein n=1 Tax=Streptomyces tritrimontium TaxID=3406573 RepID=UPI003BB589B6
MSHTHVQTPADALCPARARGRSQAGIPTQPRTQSQAQAQAQAQAKVQSQVQAPPQAPAAVPDRPLPPTTAPAGAPSSPSAEQALRGRIGTGFSPVPHRYRVYLADDDCPRCLGVASALAGLGLRDAVAVTVLPPGSRGSAAHDELRRAYEASGHHHDGTLTVPALCDGWSGRVVSNHTPDILEDLRRLGADPQFRTAG